ncbi:DUF2512 family protein [Alkalibacillus haloalkaliphilus]|uniref:DUF2512 family protein n=1 Tax=Alkalibacillus haloalkaliphilus TaxID=94136 RepID=UPI0029367CDE|nr:DUF2512 family protein [Alkalibacillus haloalkaliphilus]MDV2582056.1 DUF2512 family protein [Alkalibacillus haloalkaliphilus]
MSHVKLIAIKLAVTFAWLFVILGLWFGVGIGNIIMFTLILGALAYAGDMLIFRRLNQRYNHTVATLGDFALALVVVYALLDLFAPVVSIVAASFFSAVGLSVFEAYYHFYMQRTLKRAEYEEKGSLARPSMNLQTEASEELDPVEKQDRPK